jgi:hypothetical protein
MRTLAVASLAFVIFGAIENLIFRTSFYSRVLDPDSSTGYFELILWNELHRKLDSVPQVLAVGDSRMAAFQARIANERNTGLRFASVVVPATTPRCWYYLLRDVDPTARRYAAVLIPLPDYDDEDRDEDFADRLHDLTFLVVRIRLADIFDFAGSYPSLDHKWQAFRGSLLKGMVFKRDFQACLPKPAARLAKVDYYHRSSAEWIYGYSGDQRTLRGLSVDWAARKIHFPDGIDAARREQLQKVLLEPPAPRTGREAEYRRLWLGRIVEHYRGSGARLIFLRLPRSPAPRPDAIQPNPNSVVRRLAADGSAVTLDEHAFDALERPELFADALHLNSEGAARFSAMLAAEVRARLLPR